MSQAEPVAAPMTLPLWLGGIVLTLVSFYLFYNIGSNWNWTGFSYLVFAVILFIGAVNCFRAAYKADQKHAADMKSRAESHAARVEYEQKQVSLENVRGEAENEALLRRTKQELELLRLEVDKRMIPIEEQARFMRNWVEQRESQLRGQYIGPAKQQGLSVDQYMAVNEHWNRQMIDFEVMKLDKEFTLRLALESEDEVTRLQLNQRLLEHAQQVIQMYTQFRETYSDHADLHSEIMMDLYGGYGARLMEEYSGRGIIQAEKAKELERYFEGKGNSRQHYQIAATAS